MRRFSATLTALVLLALAAACGSGASAADVVTKAPSATISEATANVAMTIEVSGAGIPNTTTTGNGAIDFAHQATTMKLDLSDTLGRMGVSGDDATMEMRSLGTVLYMRSPLFSRAGDVATGKWLKLDLDELSKLQGVDIAQLQQAGNNDPRQGLAFLEGVSKDGVEELGHADVRGVATTHYRAEVDLEKAVTRSGAVTDRTAFKRFVDSLGTSNIEVQVWIDGDNRVRRIETPLPVPYKGDTAHVTMTMEYFDFGSAVDVGPPPAGDVLDYQDVLSGG